MEKERIMLEDYYQLDNSQYQRGVEDNLYAANEVWLSDS